MLWDETPSLTSVRVVPRSLCASHKLWVVPSGSSSLRPMAAASQQKKGRGMVRHDTLILYDLGVRVIGGRRERGGGGAPHASFQG